MKYFIFFLVFLQTQLLYALPPGFVYLRDMDASILQEMRYAGNHNFVGHPLEGYEKGVCILTKPAALALARVQKQLKAFSLTLKVYDCYRPVRAVTEFERWSSNTTHYEMKNEFYPHVNKADLFKLGYIAKNSGHSRGSTIDVTLVAMPVKKQAHYHKGQKLISCTAPFSQRFKDNSLDMGTGYDCLDTRSHTDNKEVSLLAQRHRKIFQELMTVNGFVPYEKEWWHFSLKNEPFPQTYFNFVVR